MANEIETAATALAANIALHTTSLDLLTAQQTLLVAAEVAKSLPQGVPVGSTPFSACNQAAADTAATPVVVRASPGATRMFITEVRIFNTTTAEIPAGDIRDSADVVLVHVGAESFDDDGAVTGRGVYKFNPPLIVPANLNLEYTPFATIGDVFCSVVGYDEL